MPVRQNKRSLEDTVPGKAEKFGHTHRNVVPRSAMELRTAINVRSPIHHLMKIDRERREV